MDLSEIAPVWVRLTLLKSLIRPACYNLASAGSDDIFGKG
jgi:hypothetical protein